MHFNNKYSVCNPTTMRTEIQPRKREHRKKKTSILLVKSNIKKKKGSISGLTKITAYKQ